MGTRLFVGNLSYNVNEQELKEAFTGEGIEVRSVRVALDRETGRPRGFAFVETMTDDGAKQSIEKLSGRVIQGRSLIVEEAQARPAPGAPRPGGGPGGPPRSFGPPRPPGPGGPAGPGGGFGGPPRPYAPRPPGPDGGPPRSFGPPRPPGPPRPNKFGAPAPGRGDGRRERPGEKRSPPPRPAEPAPGHSRRQ